MTQKSNNQTEEQYESPLDRLTGFLWEQCDGLVGFGVGATIVGLLWLIFHLHVAHAISM